jgi:hypothetical protein
MNSSVLHSNMAGVPAASNRWRIMQVGCQNPDTCMSLRKFATRWL